METTTSTSTPRSASSPAAGTSSYVPGVCNINTAEIAYRRKSAHVLLAISVVMTAALLFLPITPWLRVILFAPIFLTAVCYLQVKYKFCVSYGASGKQNANEGDKVAQDIIDAASKKLDRDRTRKIKLQAAGIALVITATLMFLPV